MADSRISGVNHKLILSAMITNPIILGVISQKWDKEGLFNSKLYDLIGGWCVRHFKKYEKAPQKGITALFSKWAERVDDPELQKQVSYFLENLSEPSVSEDYILDIAANVFGRARASKLVENVQSALDAEDMNEVRKCINEYHEIQMGMGAGIDVLQDKEKMASVFAEEENKEALVHYSGALKQFYTHTWERDSFVVFQAAEKVGKTTMLVDVAYRSLQNRKRVAFFSVGDLSEKQLLERLYVRISGHPLKAESFPCELQYPTKFIDNTEADKKKRPFKVDTKIKKYEAPLSMEKLHKACDALQVGIIKSKNSYLKVSVHSNDSVTINDIKNIIDSWTIKGWIPDVIIIDYMDLLSPITRGEPRDQNNATWKRARALSQDYHCLLVSATQANAASYGEHLQSRKHFSEDKRKLAHVTAMIGINITPAEKEQQSMRLNFLVKREGFYSPRKVVHAAGCLGLINPCIISQFEIEKKKDKNS